MHAAKTRTTPGSSVRALALRAAALLLTWLVIAEGDLGSLVIGAPLSLVAAGVSVVLRPQPFAARISLAGLARFVAYFAVQSVKGGIDVALRAYRPAMPLDPACVTYPLRLADPFQRVLFSTVVSLLPGTLSAAFQQDTLVVHALDRTQPVTESLADLEHRIADLFGSSLEAARGGARA